MKQLINLLFLSVALLGLIVPSFSQGSASINDAHNAYFQMDHKKAHSLFKDIAMDPSQSVDDRSTAYQYLAKMRWLFYQNPDSAFSLIDEGLALNKDQVKFHILRVRILNDQGSYDQAIEASNSILEAAESGRDRYDGEFAFCYTVLQKHKSILLEKPESFDPQSPQLKEGYARLKELAAPMPGDVDIAKLLMGYALLSGDGTRLFEGWMSFFRLTDVAQVHPSLIQEIGKFQDAVQSYHSSSSNENKKTVLLGLAESGFYEYAELVHQMYFNESPIEDQKVRDIRAYYQFIAALEPVTIRFYRSIIDNGQRTNEERGEAYFQLAAPHAMKLWKGISWDGNPPQFTKESFQQELRTRFKAIIKPFAANGYYGLQMGHIILDDERVIKQHGEEATFNYIAVDHMVSNGYSGWFWDGQAQTGGWADDEGFLQVRSAYTGGPVNKWSHQTDSVLIRKWKEDIKKYSMQDDSIARENPYAFLRGLSLRIDRLQEQLLLDSLKQQGLAGAELRLAFINTIEFLELESSIYAHEGRHVIDKQNNYSSKSAKLEYTAKLSEIYFSSKPKLAVSAVLSRNIGDQSSHGQANLQVIKGLVKWMKKNKNEIEGFDPDRPVLPQLDKLSDAQVKAAVYWLDPMAK